MKQILLFFIITILISSKVHAGLFSTCKESFSKFLRRTTSYAERSDINSELLSFDYDQFNIHLKEYKYSIKEDNSSNIEIFSNIQSNEQRFAFLEANLDPKAWGLPSLNEMLLHTQNVYRKELFIASKKIIDSDKVTSVSSLRRFSRLLYKITSNLHKTSLHLNIKKYSKIEKEIIPIVGSYFLGLHLKNIFPKEHIRNNYIYDFIKPGILIKGLGKVVISVPSVISFGKVVPAKINPTLSKKIIQNGLHPHEKEVLNYFSWAAKRSIITEYFSSLALLVGLGFTGVEMYDKFNNPSVLGINQHLINKKDSLLLFQLIDLLLELKMKNDNINVNNYDYKENLRQEIYNSIKALSTNEIQIRIDKTLQEHFNYDVKTNLTNDFRDKVKDTDKADFELIKNYLYEFILEYLHNEYQVSFKDTDFTKMESLIEDIINPSDKDIQDKLIILEEMIKDDSNIKSVSNKILNRYFREEQESSLINGITSILTTNSSPSHIKDKLILFAITLLNETKNEQLALYLKRPLDKSIEYLYRELLFNYCHNKSFTIMKESSFANRKSPLTLLQKGVYEKKLKEKVASLNNEALLDIIINFKYNELIQDVLKK